MSDPTEPPGGEKGPSRRERRALRAGGKLDTTAFLKVADKFIDVANRENQRVEATDLHLAFLWAAARYNAHVAVNLLEVPNHEVFVKEMKEQYVEMLRQHLADPALKADG